MMRRSDELELRSKQIEDQPLCLMKAHGSHLSSAHCGYVIKFGKVKLSTTIVVGGRDVHPSWMEGPELVTDILGRMPDRVNG